MKKIIDVEEALLIKLKIVAAFENLSVKALMELAVEQFVTEKEKERLSKMTDEEKEDIGLLLLMQQVDETDTVDKEEFMKALRE
ncbi:MAG: hypothetical protein WA958_01095 [Tunicatimonas sp.]